MNNYTTKTASIRATIGDIRKLDSRVIDSKEIKLDGTDIKDLWGFQDPEDFKKLVKRCELPEGSNYILWTDTGQIAYMSFADRLTNGSDMFRSIALTSFNIDLPSLINGNSMFYGTSLTSFNIDLPSLTNGLYMFSTSALTSFNGDLSSLDNGSGMFQNTALTSFNSDLSKLTNGNNMFNYCKSLTSFDIDLPSLTNGISMFYMSALQSFSGDLSSLTDGRYMFLGCKLDLTSVQNIASTINTVSSGSITLGIQSSLQDDDDLETAISAITSKGWSVTTQYNA